MVDSRLFQYLCLLFLDSFSGHAASPVVRVTPF